MKKHNAINERIKRQYFNFLKNAKGQSEQTVDGVAKALSRFDEYNKWRDFKAFNFNQAVAFKNHLAEQTSQQSGERLSKSTLNSTLTSLKRFFQWLSEQSGYKSRLQYSDADYFNLSEKDMRVATAKRDKKIPTIQQVKHVIGLMPCESDIERRNRALMAFTLLTGARDGAIASMQLKHVDLVTGSVFQDARQVKTKNSKTFTTYFFPVGDEIRTIVDEWVNYLRIDKLWGNDDPLFPATRVEFGESRQFESVGLDKQCWSTATPIRTIFREAFERAGLPYFNPHSLRATIVQLGQQKCKNPEEFKAWSQNLGHHQVLTTFISYGEIDGRRQGEIMRELSSASSSGLSSEDQLAAKIARKLFEMQGNGV